MTWAARLLIAVAALVVVPAQACSLAHTASSTTTLVDKAALIMLVQITQTRFDPDHDGHAEDYRPVAAKFRVVDVLKGNPQGVGELVSGFGNGDCGIALMAGYHVLVVADTVAPQIELWLSSGSYGLDPYGPHLSSRPHARIEALRRYINDGTPIDSCFDLGIEPPPRDEAEYERCLMLTRSLLSNLPPR